MSNPAARAEAAAVATAAASSSSSPPPAQSGGGREEVALPHRQNVAALFKRIEKNGFLRARKDEINDDEEAMHDAVPGSFVASTNGHNLLCLVNATYAGINGTPPLILESKATRRMTEDFAAHLAKVSGSSPKAQRALLNLCGIETHELINELEAAANAHKNGHGYLMGLTFLNVILSVYTEPMQAKIWVIPRGSIVPIQYGHVYNLAARKLIREKKDLGKMITLDYAWVRYHFMPFLKPRDDGTIVAPLNRPAPSAADFTRALGEVHALIEEIEEEKEEENEAMVFVDEPNTAEEATRIAAEIKEARRTAAAEAKAAAAKKALDDAAAAKKVLDDAAAAKKVLDDAAAKTAVETAAALEVSAKAAAEAAKVAEEAAAKAATEEAARKVSAAAAASSNAAAAGGAGQPNKSRTSTPSASGGPNNGSSRRGGNGSLAASSSAPLPSASNLGVGPATGRGSERNISVPPTSTQPSSQNA
jgi:hypothetical protein